MPASISIHRLSWSTPDGNLLFQNLDLSFGQERTGLVGRNGVGKTTLLRLIAGELRPAAGSVQADGTLGILRQSVRPKTDETIADLFGIARSMQLLRRADLGKATAEELAEADWTLEARVEAALARLALAARPDTRLVHLSGGQVTRARLAALIFAGPDFLLLDEPTNNLDREGRRAVIEFLSGWRGGAIIVSHDRELLEEMDAIVELTSIGATRHGGNWTAYRQMKEIELASARQDLADAGKRISMIANSARKATERKQRTDRKGRRQAANGDMPRILAGMRKRRSQDSGGQTSRMLERRRSEAQAEIERARKRIEVLQPFGVILPSTGLPVARNILQMEKVTFGHDVARPILQDFSLSIIGPERIAITGPNGSGKSTLLGLITGRLRPLDGSIRSGTSHAFFDQQVSLLDPEATVRENFRRLHPQASENDCRAALARFRFRADAAMQRVSTLSGGQLLRASLACALGGPNPPPFLILDEPTNHLDLESIAVIEAGLKAYDGALLVVSHDEQFLKAIGVERRVEL